MRSGRRRASAALLLLAVGAAPRLPEPKPATDPLQALVLIWITTPSDRQEFGSGFLASPDGRVVTCYHVVHGAKRIRVTHQGRSFEDVLVEEVYPDTDLATLRLPTAQGPYPYLAIVEKLPARGPDQDLRVFGHGAGVRDAQISARMTHRGFVSASAYSDPRGRPLFRSRDLELIGLDMTTYRGVSGGPVVGPDGVIGALSGSANEGGSLAWAIPMKHLAASHKVPVNRRASAMISWPALAMMETWTSLRRSGMLSSEALQRIDAFFVALRVLEERLAERAAAAVRAAVTTEALHLIAVRLNREGGEPDAQDEARMAEARQATEAFTRASIATWQAYGIVQARAGEIEKANDMPATPRNAAFAEEIVREAIEARAGMRHAREYFELVAAEEQRALATVARGAERPADLVRLASDMKSFVGKIASAETRSHEAELLRGLRAIGAIQERLATFEPDSPAERWTHESPWGYRIHFPPGWEGSAAANPDLIRQNEQDFASVGLVADGMFTCWNGRPEGEPPAATLIVSADPDPPMPDDAWAEEVRRVWTVNHEDVRAEKTRLSGRTTWVVKAKDPRGRKDFVGYYVFGADRMLAFQFGNTGPDLEATAALVADVVLGISVHDVAPRRPGTPPSFARLDDVWRSPGAFSVRLPRNWKVLHTRLAKSLAPMLSKERRALETTYASAESGASAARFVDMEKAYRGTPESLWLSASGPVSFRMLDGAPGDLGRSLEAEMRSVLGPGVRITSSTTEQLPSGRAILLRAELSVAGDDTAQTYVMIQGPDRVAMLVYTAPRANADASLAGARAIASALIWADRPIGDTASLHTAEQRKDSHSALAVGRALAAGVGGAARRAEAARWLRDAIKHGDPDVTMEANRELGLFHLDGANRDDALARDAFRRAAMAGDVPSMTRLAALMLEGRGGEVDRRGALAWLGRAAGSGEPEAWRRIGEAFLEGKDFPRDVDMGRDALETAAHDGDARAQFLLGRMYAKGTDVPVDLARAVDLLRRGAKAGDPGAMGVLGWLLRHGSVQAERENEHVDWLLRGAKAGDPEAMNEAGLMYEYGQGVTRDPSEAFFWYSKAAAARHHWGAVNVGRAYEHGRGVPADLQAARRWYERAIAGRNNEALSDLAWMYERGAGVPASSTEAFRLYERAAKEGDPEGLYNIARCYEYGIGARKDPYSAWWHYHRAAQAGSVRGAMSLARAYDRGYGAVAWPEEAVRLFEWAAGRGAAATGGEAAYELGRMIALGRGTPANGGNAAAWLRSSVEAGYLPAATYLGWLYEKGRGVPQDSAEAGRLYRLAAEGGNAEGMYYLAKYLESGLGGAAGVAQAALWYEEAASRGDANAAKELQRLRSAKSR
jgi:TPR repeat protein